MWEPNTWILLNSSFASSFAENGENRCDNTHQFHWMLESIVICRLHRIVCLRHNTTKTKATNANTFNPVRQFLGIVHAQNNAALRFIKLRFVILLTLLFLYIRFKCVFILKPKSLKNEIKNQHWVYFTLVTEIHFPR